MTADSEDVALAWDSYSKSRYAKTIEKSLLDTLKLAEEEKVSDRQCLTFKLPITIDYTDLTDYNPEFYEYFINASALDLKGLIRESAVKFMKELVFASNLELNIDPRQLSIELAIKHVPCSPESVITDSGSFYELAIPSVQYDENGDLKGAWDSKVHCIEGTIQSFSEPIYIGDIRSYACGNFQCRNNSHIIRHVGLDSMEHFEELGPNSELKPQVFITKTHQKDKAVQCHECREEIDELFPFRSNVEFRLVQLKLKNANTPFTIECLIVGANSCSIVKSAGNLSLSGFPKLVYEVPNALKGHCKQLGAYYFEVYGVAEEDSQCLNLETDFSHLKKSLDSLTTVVGTSKTRLVFLLLLCQLTGAVNGFPLSISLPSIDSVLLDLMRTALAILTETVHDPTQSVSLLKFKKTLPEANVRIITGNFRNSFDFRNKAVIVQEEQDTDFTLLLDLSDTELSEIILNLHQNSLESTFKFPVKKGPNLKISSLILEKVQNYFLTLRQWIADLPAEKTLKQLTSLIHCSAHLRQGSKIEEIDLDFAIMLFEKVKLDEAFSTKRAKDVCFASPSTSLDGSVSCNNNNGVGELLSYFNF